MICPSCKEEFKPKSNGRGGTKTCSRRCSFKLRQLESKKCKECDFEFKPKRSCQKFCSSSCSATYNNKRRNKLNLNYVVRDNENRNKLNLNSTCLNCGILLSRKPNKYCSGFCQHAYKRRLLCVRIEKQDYFDNDRQARKYLLDKNPTCCICGLNSWQNKEPIPLILDHINGHSEDNSFENTRLVCANCDMQLPTYKAKNKGNGRYSRRKRYKEEKSY